MTVEALIARADEADARGDVETARGLLERGLETVRDPASRGRLHAALAVHWKRRTTWRAAREHARRSVEEHARERGRASLTSALRLYDRAIAQFGALDSGPAFVSLRVALATLIEHLGDDHPFVEEVEVTLAGQLRHEQNAIDERLGVYRRLIASAERRYGAAHRATLHLVGEVGFAMWGAGRVSDARAALERAFDGYVASPTTFAEAQRLYHTLQRACLALGLLDDCERIERTLLQHAPDPALEKHTVVRSSRLQRMPDALQREFLARCVEHGAAQLPSMTSLVAEALATVGGHPYRHTVTTSAASIVARLDAEIGTRTGDSAERYLLLAVRALLMPGPERSEALPDAPAWLTLCAIDELEHPSSAGEADDYGPRYRAEQAWQDQLLQALWARSRT